MTQWNIFIAFFRAGILGYGGGPSSIPLLYREVVINFRWMNEKEFSDVLALSNTLPGPLNTKLSGYIGYRVAGWLGMINAVFATVVPTVILMIVLLVSLSSFKDLAVVEGMTKGVVPVVGVMMAVLTWGFVSSSVRSLGVVKGLLLIIASLFLIEWAGLHPGILIASLLLYALLKKNKPEEVREKKKGDHGS